MILHSHEGGSAEAEDHSASNQSFTLVPYPARMLEGPGRRFAGIDDCVHKTIQQHEEYAKNKEQILITAINNSYINEYNFRSNRKRTLKNLKKKWVKNNFIDTASDKLIKLQKRVNRWK